jgi:hypothetical protein
MIQSAFPGELFYGFLTTLQFALIWVLKDVCFFRDYIGDFNCCCAFLISGKVPHLIRQNFNQLDRKRFFDVKSKIRNRWHDNSPQIITCSNCFDAVVRSAVAKKRPGQT